MAKKSKTPAASAPSLALTEKEELFCHLCFVHLNRAMAAFKAGYGTSTRTARYAARDLLKRDEVQSRIAELREEWCERIGITPERVLREYARLAFADIGQVSDWTGHGLVVKASKDIPKDARAAIKEVSFEYGESGSGKTTVKMHDKRGPLDSIADHLGLHNRKVGAVAVGKDGNPLGSTTVILNIPDNGRKPKN